MKLKRVGVWNQHLHCRPALLLQALVFAGSLLVLAISPAIPAGPRSVAAKAPPLRKVADIPLPGMPVRFDYQSLDVEHGTLYIAHMNADQLVVFDIKEQRVLANLDGFKRVHGVLAVPELGRVYASVTGEHQVAAVDVKTLQVLARIGPITYPDGLAYAPGPQRVFVSDEHGNADAVIDARGNKLLTSIALGGEAGNTVYDAGSGLILVAVHETDELVAIDPAAARIVGRYPVTGAEQPHGIALDTAYRLAFVAGQKSKTVVVFDLSAMKPLSSHPVGEDPDVLAFDPGLKQLYVAAESGTVSVFREKEKGLIGLGSFSMPHAHTVCADSRTHLVYFPLENVAGQPLLRIMKPLVAAK